MEYKKEAAYKTAITQLLGALFADNQNLMDIPDSSDGIVAASEFAEEVTPYSEEMWPNLVKEIRDIDGIEISSDCNAIKLQLNYGPIYSPIVDHLYLSFYYSHYPYEADDDFDVSEIDGMSREEAIDYLTESIESDAMSNVPNVDFICVSLNSLPLNLNWEAALLPSPGSMDLRNFINQINDTLKKFPEVLASEDEKLKAEAIKEEEEKHQLNDVVELLHPVLREFGWKGQFCIEHFTKDIYRLCIRDGVGSMFSTRGTTEEIKPKIPKLIHLAQQYAALMSELDPSFAIGKGRQIQDLKWMYIDNET